MESLRIEPAPGGFDLVFGGFRIAHREARPFLRAGRGKGIFEMHRGNFAIREDLEELVALRDFELISQAPRGLELRFHRSGLYPIRMTAGLEKGRLVLSFRAEPGPVGPGPNRLCISLSASATEHIYGCGEQFSHLDLRGRHFPLWSSEQGVGRNKLTEITRLADADDGAGGDYFWTFYPQAGFVSSAGYWCQLETTAWADFDFRPCERHELYAWEIPSRLVVGSADTMAELVQGQSAFLGRQPLLPDWCLGGVILGIQGGTDACLQKLANARKAKVPVTGIWAQDWEGINMTSFGQRLRWNWVHDEIRYPGLKETIVRLKSEGVRFLGYINPYVGKDMSLFKEAAAAGYLAKDSTGGDYLVEFGEFYAGIVDLTNPRAFSWYKGMIKRNLIGFGLSGWMADFGEYLPTDAVLFDGTPAEIAHNAWPSLWARCNREAVDEAVAEGLAAKDDLIYFMRAGGAGSPRDCPLMWAGDQNVDWSADDGLPSVIPAALSLAMSGHGLHHSDLGGYTTLYGMKRTKELLLRWAEQAALTPVMRSHEGNRPKDNWQFDSDRETLEGLGAMGRFHQGLLGYLTSLVTENATMGLPVQRPLFLHHPGDGRAWSIQDEYLLGEDLLVAPVLVEGAVTRAVHLPAGSWIHLWSGKVHEATGAGGLDLEVAAPLGEPPVFVRAGSRWLAAFRDASSAAKART